MCRSVRAAHDIKDIGKQSVQGTGFEPDGKQLHVLRNAGEELWYLRSSSAGVDDNPGTNL